MVLITLIKVLIKVSASKLVLPYTIDYTLQNTANCLVTSWLKTISQKLKINKMQTGQASKDYLM